MPGDDNVFIGITPELHSWYLRFYLSWDDEGFELTGRFDITFSTSLAPKFRDRIGEETQMQEEDAEAYYNRIRL